MLSRRIFVTTALGAGAVLATQDHKAAAQADRRMIVDAQIHLWKAESEDWRWVPGLQPQLPGGIRCSSIAGSVLLAAHRPSMRVAVPV
jgi:hypothetical protein